MSYDIIGNIAVLKFEKENLSEKKKIAEKILKDRKNIKTVVEKLDKVKGRLRTLNIKHLAGKKTSETIHKESGCLFKLNIEKCYFSPRISNERLEIAKKIKSKNKVLVMFAGVLPFPIIIAKHSKCKEIVSIELGKECCKYGKENIKLNKLNNIKIIQGDVNKIIPKLAKQKFDVIIMPRPQLKDTFLKSAFLVSKKSTKIFYYDFSRNIKEILEKIKKQAKKSKKQIKILDIKKAGEVAPYKYKFRIEFIIKN
ncbi:MAG: methyltransferase domain-containing protein [Nanoarchaeota archaeon]|nr:methyltransferase domain-containing protein [Nanoarchaeota archaeon]